MTGGWDLCSEFVQHLPNVSLQKQALPGNLSGRKGHIFVDADIPGIGILLYLLPEVILYDARGVMFIAHHFFGDFPVSCILQNTSLHK